MSFIKEVAFEDATGRVREFYEQDQQAVGYVANYTRALSLRPEVMDAWRQLNTSIKSNMDLRRYELVTLAAANALRSSYCMLAHGKVLRSKFFTAEQVEAIARDHYNAGLTPAEVAIMDFAQQVVRDATRITTTDVESLRAHGLADDEILDVVLTASARCFFSKMLDAIGAEPDPALLPTEDTLREALIVGRQVGVSL